MFCRSEMFPVFPILLLSLICSGCGYGKVSSETYEYAKALYSICNRQDTDRLTAFYEQLSTANENQQISEQEARWLEQIADDAKQGNWSKATKECRRMMSDQVDNKPW